MDGTYLYTKCFGTKHGTINGFHILYFKRIKNKNTYFLKVLDRRNRIVSVLFLFYAIIMKLEGKLIFFIKEIKESTREVQLAEIFGNEFMKSRNIKSK